MEIDIVPEFVAHFLGGPMDGVTNELAQPGEWPDWVMLNDREPRYYRLTMENMPPWIVQVPYMDAFDGWYLWGPFFPPGSGSGGGVPRVPYPQIA